MALGHSPRMVMDGLVLCLDGANYKSFKGVPATNILNQLSYNQSNSNTALYKYTQGTENVNIPSLGYVNSKFVDIYNDYNGGSGNCCPALFTYGTGSAITVSPSTTYTYSIIYKTTTGYSHPNYMYRYEYNSSNTYLTESGVHSTNNRTSLGDGWWFAWGQFTTQATTAYLNTFLFHYEYATYNRVYVYKAALYAGTYIIPPEHMLNSSQVRGATVATGGGWADLIGSNDGTLTNGPTYSSSNGGSLIFDGTDDYVSLGNPTDLNFGTGNFTLSFLTYRTGTGFQGGGYVGKGNGTSEGFDFRDGTFFVHGTAGLIASIPFSSSTNSWQHHTFVFDRTSSPYIKRYLNGTYNSSSNTNNSANASSSINTTIPFRIGLSTAGGVNRFYIGNIPMVCAYNRALTAAEVKQNFDAHKGRYGL